MPPRLTRSVWQGNYGLAIGDGRNLLPPASSQHLGALLSKPAYAISLRELANTPKIADTCVSRSADGPAAGRVGGVVSAVTGRLSRSGVVNTQHPAPKLENRSMAGRLKECDLDKLA